MLVKFAPTTPLQPTDVCIVGAGPVGIALALACEAQNLSVLLVELGGETPGPFATALGAAKIIDPSRHSPMHLVSCRGLGGTSRWWGGRCVPFDEIDFINRSSVVEHRWPIGYDEIAPWYSAALEFFNCGPARFTDPIEPWTNLVGARLQDLERWTPRTNMGEVHRFNLEQSQRIVVLLGATVIGFEWRDDGTAIDALTIANGECTRTIPKSIFVLTCGGLETTRLLLNAQRFRPQAFGGPNGPLGRYYNGHLTGTIADLILADPAQFAALDFYLDGGAYVRRQFLFPPHVQMKEGLLNTAFWADNPPFHDPVHKSGVLSLIWFALFIPFIGKRLVSEGIRIFHVGPKPFRIRSHLHNIISEPVRTLVNMVKISNERFLRKPHMVHNKGGRYALRYHAEQFIKENSRVWLTEETDALGVPRLAVDLRFDERDAELILRAHSCLDAALQAAGLGRLEYRHSEEQRLANVMAQATDGFHQIGIARMGDSAKNSVVDANCQAHQIDNLYVVSSAIFPTGGQANPTLSAVALAFRLGEHLGLRKGSQPVYGESLGTN